MPGEPNAITITTERTLQKQKPRERKDWFGGKCRKEIDKKRQLRVRYKDIKNREEELQEEFVEKTRGNHIMEKSWKYKLIINNGILTFSTEQ